MPLRYGRSDPRGILHHMTRVRDSQPEALRMWHERQRRMFWQRWRWVIIVLAIIFILTIAYELASTINFSHYKWGSVYPGLRHPLSANVLSAGKWAHPVSTILQAVVFAGALALQALFLHSLRPSDELRLAIGDRAVSAYLLWRALGQPAVIFCACALLAFLLKAVVEIWWIVDHEQYMRVKYPYDQDTPLMILVQGMFFSPSSYAVLAAAICATAAQIWISLLIIRHRILPITTYWPAFLFLSYWVVITLLGRMAIFNIGVVIAVYGFLPLTIILLVMVVTSAVGYHRQHVRGTAN